MNVPPQIAQAFGELVVYALANGTDVDLGVFLESTTLTFGPGEVPLGSWRIEIRRTAKP